MNLLTKLCCVCCVCCVVGLRADFAIEVHKDDVRGFTGWTVQVNAPAPYPGTYSVAVFNSANPTTGMRRGQWRTGSFSQVADAMNAANYIVRQNGVVQSSGPMSWAANNYTLTVSAQTSPPIYCIKIPITNGSDLYRAYQLICDDTGETLGVLVLSPGVSGVLEACASYACTYSKLVYNQGTVDQLEAWASDPENSYGTVSGVIIGPNGDFGPGDWTQGTEAAPPSPPLSNEVTSLGGETPGGDLFGGDQYGSSGESNTDALDDQTFVKGVESLSREVRKLSETLRAEIRAELGKLDVNIDGMGGDLKGIADDVKILRENSDIAKQQNTADRAIAQENQGGSTGATGYGTQASGPWSSAQQSFGQLGGQGSGQAPAGGYWEVWLPGGLSLDVQPFQVAAANDLWAWGRAGLQWTMALGAVFFLYGRGVEAVRGITATASQGSAANVPGISTGLAVACVVVAASVLAAVGLYVVNSVVNVGGVSLGTLLSGEALGTSSFGHLLWVAEQYVPLSWGINVTVATLGSWAGMTAMAMGGAMTWRALTGCLVFGAFNVSVEAGELINVTNLTTNEVEVVDILGSRVLPSGFVGQVIMAGTTSSWSGVPLVSVTKNSFVSVMPSGVAVYEPPDVAATMRYVVFAVLGVAVTLWGVWVSLRVMRMAMVE